MRGGHKRRHNKLSILRNHMKQLVFILVLGVGKFEIILIVQASLVTKCAFSSSGQLRLETLKLGLHIHTYTIVPMCTGTAVLWSPLKVVPMDEEEDAASAPVISDKNKLKSCIHYT